MNTSKHPRHRSTAHQQTRYSEATAPNPAQNNSDRSNSDRNNSEQGGSDQGCSDQGCSDQGCSDQGNSEVNECAPDYSIHTFGLSSSGISTNQSSESNNDAAGLSEVQQQFVLKFCRQLVSVIEACDQSESAEIEVGRRQINKSQIKIKLQAEREFTHPVAESDNGFSAN